MGSNDVQFIGDLHLGHKAIALLRGFENIDLYNQEIIKRFNSKTDKKTLSFILGDVVMESKKWLPLLSELKGRLVLIGGNHDLREHFTEYCKYFESISGCIEYKGFMLTHIPIHTHEISRFRGNVHGHLHAETIKRLDYQPLNVKVSETMDKRYFNVSWDILDGYPISLTELLEKFKT